MVDVLLTSENFVKSVTNISDNVAGKYIQSAIREAQEIGLKGILGQCLFDRLKELCVPVDGVRPIDSETDYKNLLDNCQYYLAYMTIVELVYKVSYKIGNFGVTKSTDENLQVATFDEIVKQQDYYQTKADACCYELQGWIWENRSKFAELSSCDCARIKSNLYSAATCGVWLGGRRG